MIDSAHWPATAALAAGVLSAWPEHQGFLARSMAERDASVMAVTERLAAAVIALSATVDGGMARLCEDYRFMCQEILLPEELHFRRHGDYRVKTFADAERECYANPVLMPRYMNGLLVSNVTWANHAHTFADYVDNFLPGITPGANHLEIGPGHGFLLHFAALSGRAAHLTGWDVSPASVASTRHAMAVLGTGAAVDLEVRDLFDAAATGRQFDSIVLSEVLEHVEDPAAALRAIASLLAPGGRLWLNVPANSPAPDHIFLFNDAEHLASLVAACGFAILSQAAFPMSGVTLEKAIKRRQTISCVLTATRKS